MNLAMAKYVLFGMVTLRPVMAKALFESNAFAISGRTSSPSSTQGDALG
jgi:hypothetical protein